jgi:hypothetical protein
VEFTEITEAFVEVEAFTEVDAFPLDEFFDAVELTWVPELVFELLALAGVGLTADEGLEGEVAFTVVEVVVIFVEFEAFALELEPLRDCPCPILRVHAIDSTKNNSMAVLIFISFYIIINFTNKNYLLA